MAKQKEKFLAGCAERKTSAAKAEKVWELMEKFAGYGFNKCLTADALVEMADGTRKRIVEVREGDIVVTKDGPAHTNGVRASGTRAVGRVRLMNGLELVCTPDHPLWTQRGWVNVEHIEPDDFIAVARELPNGVVSPPPHEPAVLGYALSEGSLGYDSHFYLYSSSDDEIADMAASVESFDNTTARIERRSGRRTSSVRPTRRDRARPAGAVEFLFGTCGLRGQRALDKRVPAIVWTWDRSAIAILVAKLFVGDGCIHAPTRSVFYATSSAGLAEDVRRLLLKLGLPSTVHTKSFAYRGTRRPGYTVNLLGGRSAFERFRKIVGPHLVPGKRDAIDQLADASPSRALLAGGTAEIVPLALCRGAVREAILKHYPTLKAGCRALGIAYRLMFGDAAKGGLRRDTVEYLGRALDSPALLSLVDPAIAWSRIKDFELLGEAATYDIEVPGPGSFIANGIVVHNSHAAAYALVAYQTAYFKTNYPVEFMAALLTSEMGDTDKIVKYIEECRAMGVEVRPPDVNASSVQFSVYEGAIRFGLAAIKNVGEAAMESILKTRASDGAFTTLDDFCARVDLRLVNRRVMESLIKAGAFDSIGVARAQLLATLDAAMESGQRQQRDRAEGQGSFFDLLPAAPAPTRPIADNGAVPEWDDDQRLAFEKEVLGFYVSGHPLARFQPLIESLGITSSSELAAKPGGSKVLLFGQVSSLREIPTKSGNRMAFATIEDTDGTVDITVFPEPFKAAASLLRSREALLVVGKVDDTEKGRVVLAEQVRLLENALTAMNGRSSNGGERGSANACRVRVPARDDAGAVVGNIRRVCDEHPGDVPLFLHVQLEGLEVVVRAAGVSVDASASLCDKLHELLGPGAVTVEYAGRA
jgi:DNA polymerase-3 subunit alpha